MLPLAVTMAIASGALAVLACAAACIASRLNARDLVTHRVDGALEVPGSRAVTSCLVAAMLATLAFGPATFVAVLTEGGGTWAGRLAIASLVMSALLLPFAVQIVLGRWSCPRVRLTQGAVELRGFRSSRSIAWEDIEGIDKTPGRWGAWMLQVRSTPGVPLWTWALHGGLQVVDLLEDYRRNPWKRRALRDPLP